MNQRLVSLLCMQAFPIMTKNLTHLLASKRLCVKSPKTKKRKMTLCIQKNIQSVKTSITQQNCPSKKLPSHASKAAGMGESSY